jgi:RNA polymerase-binding transcription factor DksA
MSGPEAPEPPVVQLGRLREETVAAIAELDARIEGVVAARAGANVDDEHDPEGATIAFERSQAAALREAAQRRLAEIDAALDRVARGTYGVCAVCGEPIAPARLAARPFATRCIRHS